MECFLAFKKLCEIGRKTRVGFVGRCPNCVASRGGCSMDLAGGSALVEALGVLGLGMAEMGWDWAYVGWGKDVL